ncbi:hypothetical protein [Flavobacterium laiguense]|uniref:Uncharacterized protein n=1 Tax=Flavobacterium laiguense TaxID=2169409 RepID=A0A2U1JJD3_9FLAO|nr:hypothetical protein [Flavobacterium laiguense]PWA05125.1 hypothetical protein DB891_17300 [Flavobacterium laiguense]
MELKYIFILLLITLLVFNIKRIFNYIENYKEQKEIDFKKRTNLDLWKLTKISGGIFMFGLDKYFVNKSDFYFDDKNLYLINYNKPVIKHSISDIIEVSKTSISLNDRKVWKIIINDLNEKKVYKITTNDSLSNSNFSMFLDKVNENSNSIVDSNLLW